MRHALAIVRHRGEEAARRSDFKLVAILAAALVVAIGILGTLDTRYGLGGMFHFGGERNGTALSSAALLTCVAGLALILSFSQEQAEVERWKQLAALFAFMAVDEAMWIHEYLQLWTGIDWQLLYLPVVGAAAYVGGRALALIWRDPTPRLLFIGGAAGWVLSMIAEALRSLPTFWMGVGEEVFEMTGTVLFGLALLWLVQGRPVPGPARA